MVLYESDYYRLPTSTKPVPGRCQYSSKKCNMVAMVLHLQGRSDGGIYGIYTLPKSVQVNFLWGKNDVKTVIEHEH